MLFNKTKFYAFSVLDFGVFKVFNSTLLYFHKIPVINCERRTMLRNLNQFVVFSKNRVTSLGCWERKIIYSV